MVTLYGTDQLKPEDVPALLAERGIVHPLLLDPTEAYRESLPLAFWPTATLLDRDGRVIWQGVTYLKTFGDACERQLEALLAPDAADRPNEPDPGPASR